MSRRISTSQLRDDLAEVIGRVAYGRERLLVKRYGRELMALVPVEDLELLETLEDRADIEAVREGIAETERLRLLADDASASEVIR